MKPGENIEKLVRMIQETLIDSPNTTIHSNYKIKNKNLRNREIDILIQCRVNDFVIKIAVECKDYKNPISVEKIEAFHGKCQRIKGINKKVFVSSSGYQADAINAAEDFDITLYELKTVSPETIKCWFDFKKLNYKTVLCPSRVILYGDMEDVKINLPYNENQKIHVPEDQEPQLLINFIWNLVIKEDKSIWACLLYDFLKRKPNIPIEKKLTIPFEIEAPRAYFLGINGKKYYVHKINSAVEAWFEEEDPDIIDSRIFQTTDGNEKAHTITLGLPQNARADLVVSADKKLSFYQSDQEGRTVKLEKIWAYDAKTDKISKTDESDK
ncbi:MAG: restriction endonuclease [Bacteroidales bacterium]|jgi:hypothetical protein